MNPHFWDSKNDGPFSETAFREKLESMGYLISRYTYPPGTYFSAHTHAMEKIDAVLSGRFKMMLRGEPVILSKGQWLEVPAGVEHTAEVLGNEPVVSLDCIKE